MFKIACVEPTCALAQPRCAWVELRRASFQQIEGLSLKMELDGGGRVPRLGFQHPWLFMYIYTCIYVYGVPSPLPAEATTAVTTATTMAKTMAITMMMAVTVTKQEPGDRGSPPQYTEVGRRITRVNEKKIWTPSLSFLSFLSFWEFCILKHSKNVWQMFVMGFRFCQFGRCVL